MASIEYRLTPSITFPSNVEDVRTAVRWLRANARHYGLDPGRIGLWGTSAGGHLAAVAGLAPRGTFEGEDNLTQSSAVQCVLDAYGPTAFNLMDAQTEQEKAALQSQPPALAQAPPMRGGVVVGGRAAGAPPPVRVARQVRAAEAARRYRMTRRRRRSRGWWARRSRPCPIGSAPRAR